MFRVRKVEIATTTAGTPIQNDLDEFYSMVHFCNPELLGTEKHFHRNFQSPILRGREPDATPRDREEGARKSGEPATLCTPACNPTHPPATLHTRMQPRAHPSATLHTRRQPCTPVCNPMHSRLQP